MFKDQISVSEARLAIARAAFKEAGIEYALPERPVAPLDRVYLFASPDEAARHSVGRLEEALQGIPALTDWEKTSQRRGLRYLDRRNGIPDALEDFTKPEAQAEWASWAKEKLQEKSLIARAARLEFARSKETERGIE
jgi:hypothetical protein